MFNGCGKDAPEQVTFERYDEASRFLGVATAWYCETDSAFDYAYANSALTDQIYLTSDTETYSMNGTVYGIQRNICGIDDGRSTLEADAVGTCISVRFGVTIEHLALDFPQYEYLCGSVQGVHGPGYVIDCEIDDKANTYEWNGYGDSTYVIDCDIQDQLMYNDAVWIMSGNTWLNADDECDMAFYESEWTGAVVIESWAYDGDEYYYDAIAASGPEMGTSHLYIKYCGFPPTRTAYARTDCWGCFAGQNEDIVSVEFEYGKTSSFGSTTPADCVDLTNFEWEAEWAIPSYGLGDYLFVRSKATLCDSTYVMSGWSKIKVLGAGTCTEPAWWDCP